MSFTQQVLGAAPHRLSLKGPGRKLRYRGLHAADLIWTIAFVLPYAAIFLAFAVCPIAYALWIAGAPSLYAELLADPAYLRTVVNTLLFAGIGVNLKMFLAVLLSGFFLRRRWWTKPLLAVFILPWALAGVQSAISFHWMLIGPPGLIDRVLAELFGIDGPMWFNHAWLAFLCNLIAYIWKWLPFWTVIFLAGRITIPAAIYDEAEIDGATGLRRFIHVTFPLLANLYLVCTLLSTIWTVGDFTTVYFVSGGGPMHSTDVLATLGFDYAFERNKPLLGIAAAMAVVPVLIPVVVGLMRKLQAGEVQL